MSLRWAIITCIFLSPLIVTPVCAQKFQIVSGAISFYSKASLENIEAQNHDVRSLFDIATGKIAFSVPVEKFIFEKKLMQQHFNDKYLETDKYPFATFSGTVSGYLASTPGLQSVRAKGLLTIRDVKKEVDVPGLLELKKDQLTIKATFKVRLADYDIRIPQLLWQNIAEEVDIIIDLVYKPQ